MRQPRLLAILGLSLLVLTACADEPAAADLAVTWGDPACTYDADSGTVTATLRATGTASSPVTVTVTAYADENTSRPVGSASRDVDAAGTVDLTIEVERAPHVDEDGVAACGIETTG